MERPVAEKLARQALAELEPEIGVPVELCRDLTVEKNKAWAFFYNSKKFIELGNMSAALLGNGPIVVLKADGKVTCHGSTPSVEEILASFE